MFQSYRDHIPEEERGDLIAAYYTRLTSKDRSVLDCLLPVYRHLQCSSFSFITRSNGKCLAREVRQAAAREWTLWEMATSKLIPDSKVNKESFFAYLLHLHHFPRISHEEVTEQ
jgi:hypothetical protein